MPSIGEYFSSFVLFYKVKYFHFKEAIEVRRAFPGFSSYGKAFKKVYRFRNPYKICKAHLIRQGEKEVDAYGETPLPVLGRIAREFSLTARDHLIELGCGRGKGVFFLSHLTGCSATGVDWVPFFISTANSIAEEALPKLPVAFRCERMDETDFSQATAIYLYGTCLPDDQIEKLVRRFEALPRTTRIITVSYPLSDYSSQFRTAKQFTAEFPWGSGEIFLNARVL